MPETPETALSDDVRAILKHYGLSGGGAEAMARDLAEAWIALDTAENGLSAARRLVAENVSRGFARTALPKM